MSFISSLFPKKIKTFFKKFRNFNSIHNLDKKMLNYINYSNGFYIECGANDGVDQSNTWYFEKKMNWTGFLIEPHPLIFNELKKNRSKKNIFINKALGNYRNNNKFVYLTNDDLTSKTKLNENNIKNNIKVPVSTLTDILNQYNSPKVIDFFSLDVEGFENLVLQGIDFEKYKFKYFLIETKNQEVINYLSLKNYTIVERLSHHDLLFRYNN